MRKFAVVTTFNKSGLDIYGQNFIDSFCLNMPLEVDLYLYAENCNPILPKYHDRRIKVIKVEEKLNKLIKFKEKYANNPKAIGDQSFVNDFVNNESFTDKLKRIVRFKKKKRKRIKEKHLFMWNAVKFSHKVYAIFDAVKIANSDILIWMDADTLVHSKVSMDFLNNFIPKNVFSCYLGRKKQYTECGWYSMNLKYPDADKFFTEFSRMYEDAENGIFKLPEWHDSYIYDVVRKWHEKKFKSINKNISGDIAANICHPLINSELGAYFDHLKGSRKKTGKSHKEDIKINRQEDYWQYGNSKVEKLTKLNIAIFLPQLSLSFKKIKIETKAITESLKARQYWQKLTKEMALLFNKQGHNVNLITKPLQEITPDLVNSYNLDLAFIPYKQQHRFEDIKCDTYYYMQVVFKWFVSYNSMRYGSVNSLHPNYYNTEKLQQSKGQSKKELIESKQIPDQDYIFFPCQIPYDQSIKLFSDFEEIDIIKSLVKWSEGSKIPIVFESHSANPKYHEPFKKIIKGKYIYWSNASIYDLISNSKAVYTINSEIGFEAIFHNKPIVTFNKTEYDEVTINSNLNNLQKVWQKVLKNDKKVKLKNYNKFTDLHYRIFNSDVENKVNQNN